MNRFRTLAAAAALLLLLLPLTAVAGPLDLRIQLTAPDRTDPLSGEITVTARVTGAPREVLYQLPGRPPAAMAPAGDSTWSAVWRTADTPDGPLVLRLYARDARGRVAMATARVTVSNAPWWTHPRGGAAGHAYSPEPLGVDLQPAWSHTSLGHSRLVLYGGALYGFDNYNVWSADTESGVLQFSHQVGSGTNAGLAAGPHGVYVNTGSDLVALDPEGTIRWRLEGKGAAWPMVTPDAVYAMGHDGSVFALDPESGETLWSVALGDSSARSFQQPVIGDGKLFLPLEGYVGVVDLKSRRALDLIPVSPWEDLLYGNGLLYVASAGRLVAWDVTEGKARWTIRASDGYIDTPAALARGKLLYAASPHSVPHLYAADALTGEPLWQAQLDTWGGGYGSPMVAGDLVYIGAYSGGLKVFRLETGEQAGILLPSADVRATAVAAGGRLFVSEAQWGIFALKRSEPAGER